MDRIRCAARAGCLPSHPIHPTASLPPSLSPIRAILLTRAHQQLQFSLLDFLLEDAEACLLAHIERLIDAVHGALNLAACACLELAQRAQPVAKVVFGNLAASAVGHAPQFLNDPHPLLLAAPARFLQHAQLRQKRIELRIVQAQKILRLHERTVLAHELSDPSETFGIVHGTNITPDAETGIARLWQDWSPGYAHDEDVAHVRAALGTPANLEAALRKVAGDDPVLDLGCGVGYWLARLSAAGLRPVGLEPDAGRAREAGRHAPVLVGAGDRLPLADASVGAVWCLHVLHHLPSPERGPYGEMRNRERGVAIQDAIDALPWEYRELILLRHFGELPYEEIAQLKQMTLGTVKNKHFRGRQMLKEKLQVAG